MSASNIFMKSYADFGLLILRLGFGFLMISNHGYRKLDRLLDGTSNFGDPIGIGSMPSLLLVIFAEVVCSALVMLGLFTRLAVIPLIITMVVAVFIANADKPILNNEMGLLYLTTFITLLSAGPGKYSLDNRLFGKR